MENLKIDYCRGYIAICNEEKVVAKVENDQPKLAALFAAAPEMLSWLIDQEKVYANQQGILNATGHIKWESLKELINKATNLTT